MCWRCSSRLSDPAERLLRRWLSKYVLSFPFLSFLFSFYLFSFMLLISSPISFSFFPFVISLSISLMFCFHAPCFFCVPSLYGDAHFFPLSYPVISFFYPWLCPFLSLVNSRCFVVCFFLFSVPSPVISLLMSFQSVCIPFNASFYFICSPSFHFLDSSFPCFHLP